MLGRLRSFLGGDNMKFCPNCGSILEGKIKCDCGYDTLTGEVDEKTYKGFKKMKSLCMSNLVITLV